jgi:hypothetical protein
MKPFLVNTIETEQLSTLEGVSLPLIMLEELMAIAFL